MTEPVKKSSLGGDYFWNAAWSFMVAGATVIMLTVVTRTAGLVAGGIFTLALAIGQQFQTLGMYEVRTYQVTDVERRFSFGTYLSARIITVALMVVGILVASTVSGHSPTDAALIAFVALLRVFDAFEDVFYSELQRVGHLTLAGRAGFIRSFVTTAVFCVAMIATADLVVSTVITFVVSFVTMVAVFIPPSRNLFDLRPNWSKTEIGKVLIACLPLALASFIAIYLANAPRFAIDRYLDLEQQGYFAIIFMPAFAINLLSTIIFRPLLTSMATLWVRCERSRFLGMVWKGLGATLGAFVVVALVTVFLGVPILDLVFGRDVSALKIELIVLVFGGAMNSASVILYYALSTMRLQRLVFLGYLAAAAVMTALLALLVPTHGLLGASIGYAFAMTTLSAVFGVAIALGLRSDSRHSSVERGAE